MMDMLKHLKEKALTDEYYGTDFHEVIMSVKSPIMQSNKYIVKLWKDSKRCKEFVEKYIKDFDIGAIIEYEYDEQISYEYKKYIGMLLEKPSDYDPTHMITDHDHLKCGKCGKILHAQHNSPNYNPMEHYDFDCKCGCHYYFPLYIQHGKKEVEGYNSRERVGEGKKWIRNDNFVILPCRPIGDIKPIDWSKIHWTPFNVMDRVKKRALEFTEEEHDKQICEIFKDMGINPDNSESPLEALKKIARDNKEITHEEKK